MIHLTTNQLDTLRHMLGINTPWDRAPASYRNFFGCGPGDGQAQMTALEAAGAVECYREATPEFPSRYYRCTDAGRAAAMASHRTIRYPKSKRVYSVYLDVRDALGDLTFREFLCNPKFAETRRAA